MLKRILNNQKSIKDTLGTLLILSSIIPLLICSITSYYVINSFAENEIIDNFEMSNKHKNELLNSFVSSINRAMEDLASSESAKGYIQVRDSEDSEIKYINLVKLTEKMESFIYQQSDAVDGISFVWLDESLPIIRYNSYDSILNLNKLRKEPYVVMLEDTPSPEWLFINDTAFIYKSLYDPKNYENIGVAIIKINSKYLSNLIDISEYSTSFIYKNNTITFNSNSSILDNETILNVFADEMKKSEEINIFEEGKRRYLTSVIDIETIDAKSVSIIPLDKILSTKKTILISVVISSIIAIGFAAIFVTIIYKHINDPIKKLEIGMLKFKSGNENCKVEVDRNDEFGTLAVSFNEMTKQIKTLNEENEKQQLSRQQLEMSFLQAQITPHFLYNTLNVMKILAKNNRNDEVIEMSTALISLLRLASKGSEKISIEQELQYTMDYVNLIKIRKEEKIDIVVNADETLLNKEILKFSIQPFIENSIVHKNSNDILRINIDVIKKMNAINIIVIDNAGGFDKKVLRAKKQNNKKFSSIGIKNVSERIKLYYGKQYGVKINSILGEGTKVVIKIPINEYKEA